MRSISVFSVLITAFVISGAENTAAQEGVPPKAALSKAQIQQFIRDLESTNFKTRLNASKALQDAGDSAIPPLQNAMKGAVGEGRLRIQNILEQLKRNSFVVRVAALVKAPNIEAAAGLPEWDRFSKTVGADEASIQFYARLLKAEPKLFATAAKSSKELSGLLEIKAAELIQSTRPKVQPGIVRPFSVDSYAALLLLAGNESTRLIRVTSSDVSALLMHQQFADALDGPDGMHLLRLAGSYILREPIDVIIPLQFVRAHPIPEGLVLARRVLKTALRGHNGLEAMMVLLEQGGKQDIVLLESIFDNQGVLFKNTGQQSLRRRGADYSVLNSDLALAVAITLRGEDPRDFGFAKDFDRNVKFQFIFETTGFNSKQERIAAHAKYAKLFL